MSIQSERLVPTVDFWAWRSMGACQEHPVELFFHSEDTPRGQRRRNEREAVGICGGCPVLQTCRDHALSTGERYGVWGGLTENQRLRILAGRTQELNADDAGRADNERHPISAGIFAADLAGSSD